MSARFSIDTSALLDGWRRYYPPDVFPGLWRGLERLIESGTLIATEEVFHELARKDDEVFAWAKVHDQLFLPIDEAIQEAVGQILASYPRLVNAEKNRSSADPFVIALAQVHACAVVTGENPGSANRPKIPDVCTSLQIPCIGLLQLIRSQGWVFQL